MSNEFEPLSWVDGQDIDVDSMNQMTSNDNWLYNNMSTAFYNAYGVAKNTGVKVAGGIAILGPTKDKTIYKEIGFGNYFSASCKPIVTSSHTGNKQTFLSIGGIGTGNVHPDNRGFSISLIADPVASTKNYFPNQVFCHWIALGW